MIHGRNRSYKDNGCNFHGIMLVPLTLLLKRKNKASGVRKEAQCPFLNDDP